MSGRTGRTGVLALAALVLAGCSGLPVSGPVIELDAPDQVTGELEAQFDPPAPEPDAAPPEIVAGFLQAMEAIPVQANAAREYLAADAQSRWNPQRAIITYSSTEAVRGSGTIVVPLTDAYLLDARGAWQGRLSRSEATLRFPMMVEDAEWRIQRAPNALVVQQTWFSRVYSRGTVHYFDPTARMLVPEAVFVPEGDQQLTGLVRSLLSGPGAGMREVERSFLPTGAAEQTTVLVDDEGVATVALPEGTELDPQTVELAAAQLAATLGGAEQSDVRAVRLEIGGEPVTLPGGTSRYGIEQAMAVDPMGAADPRLFALADGALVAGQPGSWTAVAGPWGEGGADLRSVSLRLDGQVAAGISSDGTRLLLAPVDTADGRVREMLSGATSLTKPAWDYAGHLWVADTGGASSTVLLVSGGRVREIRVPGVSGNPLRRLIISPDGSRLAAVVRGRTGARVMVSRIRHNAQGRVIGAQRARVLRGPGEGSTQVSDIAWQSPLSLAVLSPLSPGGNQVQVLPLDGSLQASSYLLSGRYRRLAGSTSTTSGLLVIGRAEGEARVVDLLSDLREPEPLGADPATVTLVG